MQFEFIWEPSLVICRLSGRVKPEDFVVSTQAMISSPKFRPEMDKVTDLTELDLSTVTGADVERIATLLAEFAGSYETGRLVLVAGDSPLKFGLARMFEAYFGAQIEAPILVFEALDEALARLRRDDSSALSEIDGDLVDDDRTDEDPRALSGSADPV